MNRSGILSTVLASTVMLASATHAQWSKVAENNAGQTFYVNTDSIKKDKGFVYFWTITNFPLPDRQGNLSIKGLNELDCDTPIKRRLLTETQHTKSMGAGEPRKIFDQPTKWSYFPPNSVGSFINESLCNQFG